MNKLKQFLMQFLKRKGFVRLQPSERIVHEIDYLIMREVRFKLSKGQVAIVSSNVVESNKSGYLNAYVLHFYYGISKDDVLVITGYWVEGKDFELNARVRSN